MKKHPRGEEKGGYDVLRLTVSKYLQNSPVCETNPYYGLFVRRFENVLRVAQRRTNDSNPVETMQEA